MSDPRLHKIESQIRAFVQEHGGWLDSAIAALFGFHPAKEIANEVKTTQDTTQKPRRRKHRRQTTIRVKCDCPYCRGHLTKIKHLPSKIVHRCHQSQLRSTHEAQKQ